MSGGRFDICVAKTLAFEGTFSNHKADHGGKTKFGITASCLAEAKARAIVPFRLAIEDLSVAQAKTIYFRLYWNVAHCYELPAPLDLLLFDAYVNHRPGVAVQLLQEAVGATVDGIMGPETIAKAAAANPREAIARFHRARATFYGAIVDNEPDQGVFLRGWLNRNNRLRAMALNELEAVAA